MQFFNKYFWKIFKMKILKKYFFMKLLINYFSEILENYFSEILEK